MSELHNVLSLAKLHITQHYDNSEWIFTDQETFKYFQASAKKNKHFPSTHLPAQAPKASPQKKKPVNRTSPTKQNTSLEEKKIPSSPIDPLPIQREKLKPANPIEFSDFRKILQKHFPAFKLLDSQPDDTKAKEKALLWQKENARPQIVIIHEEASPSEQLFLQNLARAIDTVFFPTTLAPFNELDKNNSYRLLIGSASHIKDCNCSYFAIDPVDHYLQNPLSKAKLWQNLKNTLLSS